MRAVNLRGTPFYIHDNEDISNAIARDKDYYEDHILDYTRNLFHEHSTIVDAGAMIGNHSNYFARFLKHKSIIAFEPTDVNFGLLQINTNLFPTISIHQKALSNYNGTLAMAKHSGNWGMHTVSEAGTEKVECITLDSLNLQDVTLLKMDVEYYEPYVLEGATETIARCKPVILIEDVEQKYMQLPQMQGYSLVKSWVQDFTYLYVAQH